ncbi:MAG: glycosyltransferase [Kiritimatiellia bacterium]
MKILHLCDKLTGGGDAVAMCRLHQGLLHAGHESRILVARNEPGVGTVEIGLFPPRSILQKALYYFGILRGVNYAAITGTLESLTGHPFWNWADVVHINTLHGGYFNYRALHELGLRKPLVWTLHDMWAITGHCSHSLECTLWERGCGDCPHPEIYPAIRRDATMQEWKWKQEAFNTVRQFICPSEWLAERARRSLLSPAPVHQLFIGLDLETYRPRDKSESKAQRGLPADRHVLLYASQSLNNPFKDAAMMPRILAALDPEVKSRCVLAVMGGGDAANTFSDCGIPVHEMGYISDEPRKIALYSAADMLVYPTRADNLPLIIQEAMACGCPVASVAVGGIPEMVHHDQTGILVEPGDATGLAGHISRVLEDMAVHQRMSKACRDFAETHFALPQYVKAVVDIYRAALS